MVTQILVLALLTLKPGCPPVGVEMLGRPAMVEAVANDNRASSGVPHDGERVVRLVARLAMWYPDGKERCPVVVAAFAADNGPPRIPGPLIRVRSGAKIRAIVRNEIPGSTLVVHGLYSRPAESDSAVSVPFGAQVTVRFTARSVGTYFYWGATSNASLSGRSGTDSQLGGALIVDSPESRHVTDRVFVIGVWLDSVAPNETQPGRRRAAFVINGRSWPQTERLEFNVGELVRWRWINASTALHPMHLHGSHFDVNSRGSILADTIYGPGQSRRAVTELMMPGGTAFMTWRAEETGNWLFHCHLLGHISRHLRLARLHDEAFPHGRELSADAHHMEDMAGLVLGIHIRADSKPRPSVDRQSTRRRRRLRLIAEYVSRHYGPDRGLGFRLEDEGTARADTAKSPGPVIVLERAQPAQITVVNRLAEPTSVHWHGLNVASYFDGVPGWAGGPAGIAPAIAPGDSFVVSLTPNHAGTFMYHAHLDEERQVGSGLYGPLIVVERGSRQTSTDKILLISADGPFDRAHGLLNGDSDPGPLRLRAGRVYRFRLINIMPNGGRVTVSLKGGATVARWRAVAKDGFDLPPAQVRWAPASQMISSGETYDFEFVASAGDLELHVGADRGWGMAVPVYSR